jgi:hypothetical protein
MYMDYYGANTEVEVVKAYSDLDTEHVRGLVTVIRQLREELPEEEKMGTRSCIMAARALDVLGFNAQSVEDVLLNIMASKVQNSKQLLAKKEMVRKVVTSSDAFG